MPPAAAPHTRLLDGAGDGATTELTHPDLAADDTLDPRLRDVARLLGCAAGHAALLTAEPGTSTGTGTAHRLLAAALWLYDEAAEPDQRQRELLTRYLRHAAQHLAHHAALATARAELATLREGLLPGRLPYLPGVTLAAHHRPRPAGGGGDFYDALALPDGALGLAIGSTAAAGDTGAATVAAVGRLRAGLRAYAVMEGEDPVAVLSDLELLLRLTEPARSATALYGFAEPAAGKLVLASAGHPPPLVVGEHRTEFADTTLSAPLGMLACWEAPSVEIDLAQGETVLLYSAGLLHRTGEPRDRAFARLQSAARAATPGCAPTRRPSSTTSCAPCPPGPPRRPAARTTAGRRPFCSPPASTEPRSVAPGPAPSMSGPERLCPASPTRTYDGTRSPPGPVPACEEAAGWPRKPGPRTGRSPPRPSSSARTT